MVERVPGGKVGSLCILGELAFSVRHMQQFRRFPFCRFTAPVVAGRRLHVGMAGQLLRCRNVRSGIEQGRDKRAPKIMR